MDQLDRSSQLDEEYAVRRDFIARFSSNFYEKIAIKRKLIPRFFSTLKVSRKVDVRDAVNRSMAALQKVGRSLDLSAFLACSGGSMRKVFLANLIEGFVCLVGVRDGELNWGIDAMLLEFNEAVGPQRRRDYLQAVARFGGEVYLDDIQLHYDEERLFWDTLEVSSSPPHSLHVYRQFHHGYCDYYWDTLEDTGSQLLETVRRNGKIEVVTVAGSSFVFVSAPAPIPSLQSLTLIGVEVRNDFLEGLAARMHEWTSLSSLSFSQVFQTHDYRGTFRPQVWQSGFLNSALKHLVLEGFSTEFPVCLEDFLKLLRTNTTLESLSLAHSNLLLPFTERSLVQSYLVDAIRGSELLYLNLEGTLFADVPAIQAELRQKNTKHRKLLRRYDKVPAVAVRLFICGDAYAGKTTLLKTLSTQCRKGFHLKTLLGAYRTSSNRTRGIQIQSLVQDGIQVSAWDMAGQEEFHAFHDHMFPDMSGQGAPAVFLFVWSPVDSKDGHMGKLKSAEAFEASLRYWLKFIASKTRLSNVARKVIVVLTRKDQVPLAKQSISTYLSNLADTFRMVVEIAGIWDVNSHNSTSVKVVASSIFECARSVLEGVMVYKVCHELSTHLSTIATPLISWDEFQKHCFQRHGIREIEQATALALSLHESGQLIYFRTVPFVILDTNWFCCKVMGELIYLSGEPQGGLPFEGFVPQQYLEKILSRGTLSSFNISVAHLVDLMEAMHLCCKVLDDTHANVFIPSTLPSGGLGARTLCWRTNAKDKGVQYHHIGRRLQCLEKVVTFLTPGLFAVIQVAFKKAFGKLGGDVILRKHLISVCYQCMEIIVEFCKSNGDNVMDILVRSSDEVDSSATLKVLEEKVLRTIVRICAEPIGNQGVELVVGIIRPECLIKPALAHEREDQYVLVEHLKEDLQMQLQEQPLQATFWHTWKRNPYFEAGHDRIMDLLGFDEYCNAVKGYKRILQEVDTLLEQSHVNDIVLRERASEMAADVNCQRQILPEGLEEGEDVDTMCESMAASILQEIMAVNSKVDSIHLKLDKVGRGMDALQGEMQSVARLQARILPQLERSIDQLLFFGEEKVAGRVPRLGFLTKEGLGLGRRFVTKLSQQVKSVRIELFCEHKEGPHKVDGQEGICLTTIDEGSLKKALPYANGFLKLLTMLAKVGAHTVAGAGSSVPDFAKIVALVLDTPGLLDSLGDMPDVSSSFRGWQQWLVHVLELNGGMTEHNIFSKFRLRRALYRETSQVAWLCEHHYISQAPFPLT